MTFKTIHLLQSSFEYKFWYPFVAVEKIATTVVIASRGPSTITKRLKKNQSVSYRPSEFRPKLKKKSVLTLALNLV